MTESSTLIKYCPSDLILSRQHSGQTKERPRKDDRQFFPNDSDLCELAGLVYKDNFNLNQVPALKNKWTLVCTCNNVKDGFFGAVFSNEKEEQLVIAHRGTSDAKSYIADFEGVYRCKVVSQIHSACTFAFLAASNSKYASLSITGHSLGGWLAQITAFALEFLTVKDSLFVRAEIFKKHPHTVTFDSPGCYEMLVKICEAYYHRYQNRAESIISKLDITTYFLAPNLFSSTNKHTGRLLKFNSEVERPKQGGIVNTIFFKFFPHTSMYHSIDNFRKAFESSDSKLFEVLNWPIVTISGSIGDFLRKKCEDKLNNFYKKGTHENKFDPDCDDLNKDTIEVEYKVRKLDTNFINRSVFTDSEFAFLEDWKELRENQVMPSEIEKFLGDEKFKTFLPDFRVFKNGVYCNSPSELKMLVNRTKRLLSHCPEVKEVMKKGILKIPIYEAIYKIASDFATNHFNQIFFNLSLAKVAINVDLQALRDFISEDRPKQLRFFVTGENSEILDIIPKDRIILGKEDEYNNVCLNNVENTIFKLRVNSDKSVQCTEIFDPDLYRKRKFYSEINLSTEILGSEMKAIFKMVDSEFKIIERKEYCLFISKSDSVLQNFKIRESEGIVEILNTPENFKFQNKPLCLVKLDGKKLVLKKHFGELKNILTFKIPDKSKLITEDDLLAKNEKITLIINNPGMGKSTILLKLAKRINNSWIFWIDLIKAHEFVNENSPIDFETVSTFLLKLTTSSSGLEKYLLIHCLQNESIQIHVFFDAFDEIRDVKDKKKEIIRGKIIEIIKFLKNKTRAKIWITSRVYDVERLEKELNIFSIGLKEFDEKEQKEYLEKFGFLRSCLMQKKIEKVQVSLIRTFNVFLSEKRNSFMGIPLQLRMIGEIFLSENSEIPDNFNSIDLYRRFVFRRYEIYFKSKKSDFFIREESFDLYSKSLEEAHKNVATNFFFKDFITDLPAISADEESELNRIGIVKINGGDIQFVHQTFAEYFCSLKLIDLMKARSDDENFQKYVIKHIFLGLNYRNIRSFVNDIIQNDSSFLKFVPKLWEKVFRVWKHTELSSFNQKRLCILHLFLMEKNEKLAVAILKFCGKDLLKKLSTVLYIGYTILHLAAKFGFREVLEIFLNNNIYETINLRDSYGETVLSYTANRKNLNDISLKLVESGADLVDDLSLWSKLVKLKDKKLCLEILNIRKEELSKTWIPTFVLSQLIGRNEKVWALKVVEIGLKIDFEMSFKVTRTRLKLEYIIIT